MLVLSRIKNESIMINDDVEITIVDIRGDKVRLGIVAPKNVSVHRKEVYEAIQREKEEQKKTEKNSWAHVSQLAEEAISNVVNVMVQLHPWVFSKN